MDQNHTLQDLNDNEHASLIEVKKLLMDMISDDEEDQLKSEKMSEGENGKIEKSKDI